MVNSHLAALGDYPFDRLRTLFGTIEPPQGLTPRVLSVGEPRHAPPPLVSEILAAEAAGWGRYPPVEGTPDLRRAICGWLERRFAVAGLDADRHVLPVAGSREALFLAATITVPDAREGPRPAVVLPNPFYHVYLGAAVMTGAEPVYLSASAEDGWRAGLDRLPTGVLDRAALVYLCSPGNPHGAALTLDDLTAAVRLARAHGFVLAVDECYTEIYGGAPPPGALQACAALGDGFANVLVFHSLSKRSSVPGLRSGFVAGDADLIAAFRRLRSYAAATVPLPIMAVSAALWNDDIHVDANRALYRRKFDLAESILENRFGVTRPDGGFFLWLAVGDDEAAARTLWEKAAIRTLPGRYLARSDASGRNPGEGYLRVALIDDEAATEDALRRIGNTL